MTGESAPHRSHYLRPGEGEALLLAVPPLLVVVLGQWLFEAAGFDLVGLGDAVAAAVRGVAPAGLEGRLFDFETRLLWALAAFLNLAAALALTAVAGLILFHSVELRGLRLFVPIGLVLIALGIASFYYATHAETPISGLFRFTYHSLLAAGGSDPGFLLLVKVIVVLLNLLSMVAPLSAMMAACSTLAPPRDGGAGDIVFLAGQVRSLKALAVLGSLYMVAGVMHLGVWLAWPANLAGAEVEAAQIQSFAKSVSVYWGGCFTVLIAAFYAPAMIVLRHRAKAVIDRSPRATGGETPERFLEGHGLSLSLARQMPQIAAVMAPLLAGPLGSAVSAIAGAVPPG